ncbi:MAG: hypothetical protein J6W70_06105 [Lentisphaeria bacterium]|nr:hypothetical protein [Lentisphaeria bacterium]
MTKNDLDFAANIVRGVLRRMIAEKNGEIEHNELDKEASDAYVTAQPQPPGKEPQNEERNRTETDEQEEG